MVEHLTFNQVVRGSNPRCLINIRRTSLMRAAFFLYLGTARDSDPVGSESPICLNLPFLTQHFTPNVRIVSANICRLAMNFLKSKCYNEDKFNLGCLKKQAGRENDMGARIVGLICCILCAVPFLIISAYNKDSREPIPFWSGDTTLKSKVKNIPEYNKAMALLYRKCAIAFLVTGLGFLVMPAIGIVMICLDCTIGIYIAYRNYKRVLALYE